MIKSLGLGPRCFWPLLAIFGPFFGGHSGVRGLVHQVALDSFFQARPLFGASLWGKSSFNGEAAFWPKVAKKASTVHAKWILGLILAPFSLLWNLGQIMRHARLVQLAFEPKARPQTHPRVWGHPRLTRAIFGFLAIFLFWLGWRLGFLSFFKLAGPTGVQNYGQIFGQCGHFYFWSKFFYDFFGFKKSSNGVFVTRGHFILANLVIFGHFGPNFLIQ